MEDGCSMTGRPADDCCRGSCNINSSSSSSGGVAGKGAAGVRVPAPSRAALQRLHGGRVDR